MIVTRKVLNLDKYLPALLTQISNKWSRGSSRIYLQKFNVGINEWAVMSMLAIEPEITANRVCSVIGMDKALAGRSLRELESKKLVLVKPNASDGRSKVLSLTREGYKLHDRIIDVALDRERQAVSSLSPKDIETLISLLNTLRKNVVRMQSQSLTERSL